VERTGKLEGGGGADGENFRAGARVTSPRFTAYNYFLFAAFFFAVFFFAAFFFAAIFKSPLKLT
jgi:hypothetical protein